MAPSTIDPSIRAAAIADLLSGDPPVEVAERYGLDPSKVRVWKKRYVTGVTDSPTHVTSDVTPADVAPGDLVPVPQQIGALILDLLRAKLQASQAIAAAATNPAWLDRQSAADLAVLGEYLDRSAFALGDRLAGQPGGDRTDGS
jgi:hypothetical protein